MDSAASWVCSSWRQITRDRKRDFASGPFPHLALFRGWLLRNCRRQVIAGDHSCSWYQRSKKLVSSRVRPLSLTALWIWWTLETRKQGVHGGQQRPGVYINRVQRFLLKTCQHFCYGIDQHCSRWSASTSGRGSCNRVSAWKSAASFGNRWHFGG